MNLIEAQKHVGWAVALITVSASYAICVGLGAFLKEHSRLRAIVKAAQDDMPEQQAAGITSEQLRNLPTLKNTNHLNTQQYTVMEVSNDILLSVLARALKTEGLVISNTERSSLRIHRLSDRFPPLAAQDDVHARQGLVIS